MIFGIEALTTVRDLTRRLVTVLRQITNRVDALEKGAANVEALTSPSGIPIGGILQWTSNSSLPVGYSICDGTELNRTVNSDLFAVIGTTYGVGNGTTTFNKPNYKGLVPRGAGTQDVNGRTKDGGTLGEVLEDAMQPITGSMVLRNNPVSGEGYINSTLSSFSGAFTASSAGNKKQTASTSSTYPSVDAINLDSASVTRTENETRASSLATIFIIKAQNLETASATTSAVDSLNSRASIVETNQNAQKLIQIVATQRTFKTTSGAGDIVASDAAVGAVNAWIKRLLNYSSQTSNSTEYFEFEATDNRIRIKKVGKYKIETTTQHRRANFGQVMSEYFPPSGISQYNGTKTRTTPTATDPASEQNISVCWILDVLSGREGGVIELYQWSETNTSNERYGHWYTRGSGDAPYNYTDTCSLSVTLIED